MIVSRHGVIVLLVCLVIPVLLYFLYFMCIRNPVTSAVTLLTYSLYLIYILRPKRISNAHRSKSYVALHNVILNDKAVVTFFPYACYDRVAVHDTLPERFSFVIPTNEFIALVQQIYAPVILFVGRMFKDESAVTDISNHMRRLIYDRLLPQCADQDNSVRIGSKRYILRG